jgi:hypothetical protein
VGRWNVDEHIRNEWKSKTNCVAAATIIGLGATLMAPKHALSDVDSTAL